MSMFSTFFEQVLYKALSHLQNIFDIYKRHFQVDLGKFRLTVCTQVLHHGNILQSGYNDQIRSTSEAVCTAAETVEGHRSFPDEHVMVPDSLWLPQEYSFQASVSRSQESLFCKELSCKLGNLALHHDISLKIRSS